MIYTQDAEELLQILMNLITDAFKPETPVGGGGGSWHSKGLKTSLNEQRRSNNTIGPFIMDKMMMPSSPSSSLSSPSSTAKKAVEPEPFRNPLSGWLASTLQCCTCKSRRPVQNSAFIDVALPLPDSRRLGLASTAASSTTARGSYFRRSHMLNGGSAVNASSTSSHHHLRMPSSSSSSSTTSALGGACHLMECLRDFATEELVHDVECFNCTVLELLEKNEKEIVQAEAQINKNQE